MQLQLLPCIGFSGYFEWDTKLYIVRFQFSFHAISLSSGFAMHFSSTLECVCVRARERLTYTVRLSLCYGPIGSADHIWWAVCFQSRHPCCCTLLTFLFSLHQWEASLALRVTLHTLYSILKLYYNRVIGLWTILAFISNLYKLHANRPFCLDKVSCFAIMYIYLFKVSVILLCAKQFECLSIVS